MTTFTIATNEYGGEGKERAEYHAIVVWVSRPLGRIVGGQTFERLRAWR
jgi:hypothetical protein